MHPDCYHLDSLFIDLTSYKSCCMKTRAKLRKKKNQQRKKVKVRQAFILAPFHKSLRVSQVFWSVHFVFTCVQIFYFLSYRIPHHNMIFLWQNMATKQHVGYQRRTFGANGHVWYELWHDCVSLLYMMGFNSICWYQISFKNIFTWRVLKTKRCKKKAQILWPRRKITWGQHVKNACL